MTDNLTTSHSTATDPIDNFEDVIDSRDILARVEELEDILSEYGELPSDLLTELTALRDVAKQAEDYSEDWAYGAELVRDSHFADYAQDLCEECYELTDDGAWHPARYIDWSAVARDMQVDYSGVTFDLDGQAVTYWVR